MQYDNRQFDEPELEITSLDEAAALWSECLREAEGDEDVLAAFERWRGRNPEHAEAFERVDTAQLMVESVADEPGIMTLRNETLSRVAMQRMAAERMPVPGRRRRFSAPAMAAVFAAVMIAALGVIAYEPALRYGIYDRAVALATGTEIYRTGIGQRSMVTLNDGSTLSLNTDSLVQVDYSENIRQVNLRRGQALFEVEKDRLRPFIVDANGHRVTALGTAFDVRQSADSIEVTLIEGRVLVERTAIGPAGTQHNSSLQPTGTIPKSWLESPNEQLRTSNEQLVLTPGQQFVHAANVVPVVRLADVGRITSWRDGRVIFDDDSLSSVVAEMNRYSHRRIILDDRRLTDLEVSGAFDTGKTDVFVEALTTYFPIRVIERDDDKIVLAWNG